MPRTAGRRGVRESHAAHLLLSQFRLPVASPPSSGDVTMGLQAWTMLGNDVYGDCGPAATMHCRMAKALVSVDAGVPSFDPGFTPPTTATTEALYFAYGRAMQEPGTPPDQGVANATWLEFCYRQGVVEWYGELDPSDPDEVHAAMLACRGVLVAVRLPADAEAQFEAHEPWSIDGAGIAGGHDILLVRYSPDADTFVTWGALQEATVNWDALCITDAWAFGTKEDAGRAGFTFAAIKQTIDAAGATVVGEETQ